MLAQLELLLAQTVTKPHAVSRLFCCDRELTAGQTCMVPVPAAPADRRDETGLITATAPMTALLDYRVLD